MARLLAVLFRFTRFGLWALFLPHLQNPRKTPASLSTKPSRLKQWGLHPLIYSLYVLGSLIQYRASRPSSLPQRLRLFLQKEGPIFIKLGQALSIRGDLFPPDFITELTQLQDRVSPFSGQIAKAEVALALACTPKQWSEIFSFFDETPLASASVAQVHRATLTKTNEQVAVKILRPGIKQAITRDIELLFTLAGTVEKILPESKRLKPKAVIAEFAKHLTDELDLLREGASAAQLRRNFDNSPLLLIPKVYWQYSKESVLVLEFMEGIALNQPEQLAQANFDLPRLGREGTEVFFTQVFRDGFFHADMHPGNILISTQAKTYGKLVALDFGIIGTLSDNDKYYLAQNFSAFFNRDYRRFAIAHIESGWVPADTPLDELEQAARTCCEPIFDRPLSEVSFAQVLVKLFQISGRFHVEIQPQLALLQKTMFSIEHLGRQLDPQLDIWEIGRPILEKWLKQSLGIGGLRKQLQTEAQDWPRLLPQLPRLLHASLNTYRQANQPAPHTYTPRSLALPFWSGVLSGILLIIGVLLGISCFSPY